MQTIKIINKDALATEQHDLELIDIKEINIFNKKFKVVSPCNLNIYVTNVCDNNCYFCNSHGKDTASYDLYYDKLEMILKEISSKDFEITITGGEPTKYCHKLVKTLELLNKYDFKSRTFCTTGEGLLSKYEGKEICQHMIENNFIHNISISRIHYNDYINSTIMKKTISNEDISKLSYFYKINDASMRISCCLARGYIDSLNKVINFVNEYKKINVNEFIFRELCGVNDVKIKDIVSEMILNKGFSKISELTGLFYDVDIYKYEGNIVKIYKNKKSNIDALSSMVYKDGILKVGESLYDKGWR